jgi:non-canonical purine NTP pyrophosphatase (RdgB/HAM1 family)
MVSMHRIPVESSDILSIGYDAEARLLEIEFHGGRVYQYRNVDTDIHEQLMRADSHGQYFNTFIHGRYRFDRLGHEAASEETPKLGFATGNNRKFRDLRLACEPFGIDIEQLDLPIDEIQSQDAGYIALQKAKQAYKLSGRPVVVNDAYWNILALHGFPGAYMADMTTWLKPEDFLKLLEDKTDRTIICTDTLVYYDGKRSKAFSEDYVGTITTEPRGKGRVTIDQIVVMAGHTKTIAELEDTEQRSSIDLAQGAWHDFAKWYNMQRRIGRA